MADELKLSHDYGWCGPMAIVAGLRHVLVNYGAADNTVTFLVADHPLYGKALHMRQVVGIAVVDTRERWRWCGEGDKPMGANSSSICDFDPDSLAEVVAEVACRLAICVGRHRDARIYRERGVEKGR
jgi:hypothetical protein